MRVRFWTPDVGPEIAFHDGGLITFYDYPDLWNCKEGEEIIYFDRTLDRRFVIVSVRPAGLKDYPPSLNKVMAEEKTLTVTLWLPKTVSTE
jgi:hypothetical protein